ncbi:hypothetical protein TBLA_0E04380 [Henningerozyma blattae CBS 6284]|uniref:Uncharacterized protein n=1 Tax=Henningerozyma blattae (strain ATCC 34711 / CBS 6284 / DSM 70876 / NBRC 10599 / NRRL Y-10934 / UCD 77-7) TaxID=1071380 RepID=I2H540_HENB6|nr:hypothetical protein TBLA_0E04380 [Tetrapisispora blattae CBS 6284]CCH61492.1 hypothetical protein TBLA_0E04380 [Tetrapisispora blattae CBS 6284]
MPFSYENYMNLLFHLDRTNEEIPTDIAKRIVQNSIAPLISVTATPELDKHVQDSYNIDSLYMLLRYFGGCISDRDQYHEPHHQHPNELDHKNELHAALISPDTSITETPDTSMDMLIDNSMNTLTKEETIISTTTGTPTPTILASPTTENTITKPHNKTTTIKKNTKEHYTTTHNYTHHHRQKTRKRSNSLFQRDSTQSQYIRFTKPIPDLVNTRDPTDSLFDHQSLETLLKGYLKIIETNTTPDMPHNALKKSLYHRFFSMTVTSTTNLCPFESFDHPIVSLLSIDLTLNQNYDTAKEMLIKFKNIHSKTPNFPVYLNINDILPVFLLCYDASSPEQLDIAKKISTKIKKQLFFESILLPLWNDKIYNNDKFVKLHEPMMSSVDETLYFLQQYLQKNSCVTDNKLPLSLVKYIYEMIANLSVNLIIPFMQRKIRFWDETILQPRKSIFRNKLFKSFMNRNSNVSSSTGTSSSEISNSISKHHHSLLTKDSNGHEYFSALSTEFQLRKLADWSMMVSDFKTAYTTYESLSRDLENTSKYMASCLEWWAVSILMGAQNIVTAKMLKNDVDPLIESALESYEKPLPPVPNSRLPSNNINSLNSRSSISSATKAEVSLIENNHTIRSYEIRCMLLLSELFLSLSDTWTSTPYALRYLETILSDYKLGPCSQTILWERLSFCYDLRVDPRIKRKPTITNINKGTKATGSEASHSSIKEVNEKYRNDGKQEKYSIDRKNSLIIDVNSNEEYDCGYDILSDGFTRKRKAAFFKLIAAKKWSEQKQWRQLDWCLKDIENVYKEVGFSDRKDLILIKLKDQLNKYYIKNNIKCTKEDSRSIDMELDSKITQDVQASPATATVKTSVGSTDTSNTNLINDSQANSLQSSKIDHEITFP